MKTTLKKTLRLAENGSITDMKLIESITKEFISISLSELEHSSESFSFIRDFKYTAPEYSEDPEAYLNTFKFLDILYVIDQFRDKGEDEERTLYLRNVMTGLLESDTLQSVRMFNYISLNKFLQMHPKIDYDDFNYKTLKYLKFPITDKVNIREFYKNLKNVFLGSWNLRSDIKVMRQSILDCGDLLDKLLIQCLMYDNQGNIIFNI